MSKAEFFGTLAIGLIGGIFIGYSKAREKFLEAIIEVIDQKEKMKEKES